MRLAYDDGRRFFVYAGINPDEPLHAQNESDLVWIRESFLSDGLDDDRLFVDSHMLLSDRAPDLRSIRLNIDTGAVFGGPPAAAMTDVRTKPIEFCRPDEFAHAK